MGLKHTFQPQLPQGVGFEPTWVAPNGFQDRLVMTASITLRVIIPYIIPQVMVFVKVFREIQIRLPLMKSTKQEGRYLSGICIRTPSMCRNRASA